MKKMLSCLLIPFFVLSFFTTAVSAAVDITINTDQFKWKISEHLVGVHFVYSNDKDIAYANGDFAAWANTAKIGTGRFPGGTVVKFWDWENPTGVLTGDPWDPNWNAANNAPASEWMSLDEYLTFVAQSGITPMFGVNALSGEKHNRRQDSIDRAVRMVEYVKNQGYGGAIWYIGNEEEHEHGGTAKYAQVFKLHAQAMKAVDPDILIFWNTNGPNANKISTFLANDGGTADGLETHGKWPYGGTPNLPPGTFDEWKVEVPLRDRKNSNRAWRFAANTYRNAAVAAGRPNLLIANNEYGLGKGTNVLGFNRYTKGLLLTDMLQEHFLGNWFSTAYWSNILNSDEGSLLSKNNNYQKNPFHLGMELLGVAQGANMVQSSSTGTYVYGFAATTRTETLLYLLNKTEVAQAVNVTVNGVSPSVATAKAMVDTADHFGTYQAVTVTGNGNVFSATLPAMSYTRIVFTGDNPPQFDPFYIENAQHTTVRMVAQSSNGNVKMAGWTGNLAKWYTRNSVATVDHIYLDNKGIPNTDNRLYANQSENYNVRMNSNTLTGQDSEWITEDAGSGTWVRIKHKASGHYLSTDGNEVFLVDSPAPGDLQAHWDFVVTN